MGLLPLSMVRQIRFDRREPTMTACWIWTGTIDRYGSGQTVNLAGETTTARQAVYERLRRGPTPGMLTPLCKQKACCNPNHMGVKRQARLAKRRPEPPEARWVT